MALLTFKDGLAILFITFLYYIVRYRNSGISTNPSSNVVSGPKGKPIVGNLGEFQTKKGDASCVAWYSLYKRFGPAYEMTIPFYRIHVINHPKYLEYFQKTNVPNFIKGSFSRHMLSPLQRDGIFVVDGDSWHFQRKSATRAFSKKNFENHITTVLHHHLDILVKLFRNLAKSEKSFNFQEIMSRFTVLTMLHIAFHEETEVDATLTPDPKCLESNAPFIEAFDSAQHLFDQRRRNSIWQITEFLSGKDKLTKNAVSLIYQFMDNIVQARIDKKKSGLKKDDENDAVDLLDLFMESTDSVYTLSGMCVNFLLAGRDTTAYSITWLFLEMFRNSNKHLECPKNIRDELYSNGIEGFLQYGESNKLKYLNGVWNESIRLNTVSPAGQMQVAQDDVLPAVPEIGQPARPVKKGDLIAWQNYVLSRMPEVWGEDSEQFKPSRWFNDQGQLQVPSPFVFHSWNAGPRTCLGKTLATHEAIAVTACLLPLFDIILDEPGKKFESQPGLNMGVKGGLWMKVKERKE